MSKIKDLSGKKFGKLLILNDCIRIKNKTKWKTRCECGFEKYTFATNLVSGNIKACRKCSAKDHSKKRNKTISLTFFNNIKISASRRGIKFDLTIEYLWNLYKKQNQKCIYTDLEIPLPSQSKYNNGYASLDRIDSTKGYIEGNVQWVHKIINYMKHTLTNDEFIKMCNLVTNKTKIN